MVRSETLDFKEIMLTEIQLAYSQRNSQAGQAKKSTDLASTGIKI